MGNHLSNPTIEPSNKRHEYAKDNFLDGSRKQYKLVNKKNGKVNCDNTIIGTTIAFDRI